ALQKTRNGNLPLGEEVSLRYGESDPGRRSRAHRGRSELARIRIDIPQLPNCQCPKWEHSPGAAEIDATCDKTSPVSRVAAILAFLPRSTMAGLCGIAARSTRVRRRSRSPPRLATQLRRTIVAPSPSHWAHPR